MRENDDYCVMYFLLKVYEENEWKPTSSGLGNVLAKHVLKTF